MPDAGDGVEREDVGEIDHALADAGHLAVGGAILDMIGIDAPGQTVYDRLGILARGDRPEQVERSEEHTSELQSLMRISYAVFCLKKKKKTNIKHITNNHLQIIQ